MTELRNLITKTPLMTGTDSEQKRAEIKACFNNTWSLYEALFEPINQDAAYYIKHEPLRHPLIFYFGHTATFFVNKLMLGKYIDECVNPHFESMFAIGVDEMSWDDLDEAHVDWPGVAEVRAYRREVNALVNRVIDEMPLDLPITQDSLAWVILMGIEHERIHLETSSVIIRMMPLDYLNPHPLWAACTEYGAAPENQCVPVEGQKVVLGKPESVQTYGWDNEYGRKEVTVDDFACAKYLVSNQEYLAFVEDGGYQRPEFWTEEGQHWLEYTQATMPRFWLKQDGQYFQRNLLEIIPLPLNWPVEVNYLEAKAFCHWKSANTGKHIRLPTEAEWVLIRDRLKTDLTDWTEAPGNINLEGFASSCPVDRYEQGGIFDIIGNVWQWTETPIDGYPGFEVHPLYDDFSTPTFDGKHNLIKGGSWISTGNEATRHARYAFRRHFFQHAGFRYIEASSDRLPDEGVNIYETDALVSQYLEFHYGSVYFDVPNYPVNCIETCLKYVKPDQQRRALDLGCSVGRSTFELARHFPQVDGIDFSARFIQHAHQLKDIGRVRYTIPVEGELTEFKEVNLDQLGYGEEVRARVDFVQGDACNLKPRFSDYDFIFCGNLIDRLYDPALFLERIGERLNAGGYLVLTSPYTWLEEYTAKDKWLGGIKVNGENFTTLDGLKAALQPRFALIQTLDIPFVIRETQRKFQHTIAQMTIWKKHS